MDLSKHIGGLRDSLDVVGVRRKKGAAIAIAKVAAVIIRLIC